jgi:6-pyruvoyltetrahydropterin/6-carboxytetrahydropterin synthase
MLTLGYTITFSAAHRLLNYKGKCARQHGHTWTVQIELTGSLNKLGMIVDFNDVKALADEVLSNYDHQDLNEFFAQPTCEYITLRLFDQFSDEMRRKSFQNIALKSITVWESEHSYCRVE